MLKWVGGYSGVRVDWRIVFGGWVGIVWGRCALVSVCGGVGKGLCRHVGSVCICELY